MCGIAGIVSIGSGASKPSLKSLEAMVGAISHRGPDEFGVYRDNRAGLAHARLSIVDVKAGQQPLTNHDKRLWLVFNGEIYNHVELKAELTLLGYSFRTQSDTEVLINAYSEWGDGAFQRFNGQWAVALWDPVKECLLLSRDPHGIAPLYYYESNSNLYFASEVKSIFAADENIPRELDPVGLDQTFTFWSIVPPQSVFKGIKELPPGAIRVYHQGAVSEYKCLDYQFPRSREEEFSGSVEEAGTELLRLLAAATKLRLQRSDVPVGCYLSGGLDSSIVAALAHQVSSESFSTFSLCFEDDEYDESSFQKQMVKHIGSRHSELLVKRSDIANAFRQVIEHTERPILRTAPVPLFMLSKLVQDQGIKTVLTGEGADEFIAGYDIFREAKVRRFWAKNPDSEWRHLLLDRLYPYLKRSPVAQRSMAKRFFGRNLADFRKPGFSHFPRWLSTSSIKRLYSVQYREQLAGVDVVADYTNALPSAFSEWKELNQDQYIEITTLLAGYLLSSQGDRMLMAHSVEGRFPFLDMNVVHFVNSLPPSYKLHVLNEKFLLKKIGHGLIPRGILQRKKQPYRAPDALAFIGHESIGWLNELLAPEMIAAAGVFDPRAVTALWGKCQKQAAKNQFSNIDNMSLTGVISTQQLFKSFVQNTPTLRRSENINFSTMIDVVNA